VKRRAVAGLLLLLTACGGAARATAIPSDEIPFSLAGSSAPPPPATALASFSLAFVLRGRLVDVTRQLSSRLPVESVLTALLDGPTAREDARGITSEIPSQTRLLTESVVGGVVQVNLSREFQGAGSSQSALLRVAEVVRTLTSLKGVSVVRFLIDGVFVSVPTDNGVVDRPVGASDYASVRPKP
jgi:Sporulation and spore germination